MEKAICLYMWCPFILRLNLEDHLPVYLPFLILGLTIEDHLPEYAFRLSFVIEC